MARRFLKRYLPDHKTIREHKYLRCFGTLLHAPNLWHLNRRSVPRAFSIGLFMAWVPVPFQMVLAAGAAILLQANLPISVCLVWITNPATMPVLFYFAYKVGGWILDEPVRPLEFQLTFEWLGTQLHQIWQPFLLGCLVLGIVSAILGNILIRLFWVFRVRKDWQIRQESRRDRIESSDERTH